MCMYDDGGGWKLYRPSARRAAKNHTCGECRTAPLTRLLRWHLACWRDRNGDLRPVEDVQALTQRAIDTHLRKFPEAVSA